MNPRYFPIIIFCFAAVFLLSISNAEERTWKNKEGKSLKGELVEKRKATVVIRKGEKDIAVKIDDLSDEDKQWLDELVPYVGFEYEYNDFEHRTIKTKTKYGKKSSIVQTPLGEVKFMNARARPVGKVKVAVVNQKLHFHVTSVDEDSPAANAGIEPGTVITKINGKAFRTVDEYETWDDETTSDIRTYTCEIPKDDGKTLKKTVRIVPEWINEKEEAEKLAAKIALEKEEKERLAAEKEAKEKAAKEAKAAADAKAKEEEYKKTREDFEATKEAVVFEKPSAEFKEPKEDSVTEKEKTFAADFVQTAVKPYLKFKHDAIFNDDVAVEKMVIDLPKLRETPVWTATGTVKAPTASGVFLTHEYQVRYFMEDGQSKPITVELGDEGVYVNSDFTRLLKKKDELEGAKAYSILLVEKEKKYDDEDYSPEIDKARVNAYFDLMFFYIYTQRIELRLGWINVGENLIISYQGNRTYKVEGAGISYTKYGDDIITDESARERIRSRKEEHKKSMRRLAQSEYLREQVELAEEREKTFLKHVDEFAVIAETGTLDFVVMIQHHPQKLENKFEWTFTSPPKITRMTPESE